MARVTTEGMATGQGASRAGSWWRGRYGSRLVIELFLCGGLFVLYRSVRGFTRTDLGDAFANARGVVNFETMLGLPFEDNLQGWLIDHPTIIRFLNHYYLWFHFPTVIGLLVWLYLRHPRSYVPFRNLLAVVTFAALVIHLVYPLAPPRMMHGFVDTLHIFGPSIYPSNALDGAANQIAAMPSLHFGWALIEAIAVISVLTSAWRWLAVLHPVLMALSIIATANHWWMDAAASAAIIVASIIVWRVAVRWAGDRTWSWRRFGFQTDAGIAELESFANSAEPVACERVD
jgi:hypothetical protein